MTEKPLSTFHHPDFTVKNPTPYDSFQLGPPQGQREAERSPPPAPPSKPVAIPGKHAVWVVHGMGQQVPFQTVEDVAEGICGAAERAGHPAPETSFSEVRVDKTVLQRVELKFRGRPQGPGEVHLYECYWAPKTEGVVKLRDVLTFLWLGGWHGLVNYFVSFERALFDRIVHYKLHLRTPLYLLGVFAMLASLMVINAITLLSGGKFLGVGKIAEITSDQMVLPLTVIATIVSSIVITFGVVLYLAEMARPGLVGWDFYARIVKNRESQRAYRPVWSVYVKLLTGVTWVALIVTGAAVVGGAGLMAYLWKCAVPGWLTPEFRSGAQLISNALALLAGILLITAWIFKKATSDFNQKFVRFGLFVLFCFAFLIYLDQVVTIALLVQTRGGYPISVPFPQLLGSTAWVWPFLILISALVRNLMVQYVGDVAGYISSNKLDRFDDLRKAIKAIAKESMSAVYAAMPPGSNNFEYEKVAIVGHSLGSVIAYDTLNRLLADDHLVGRVGKIAERTSIFLTFGSPLDKIAFFFSMMGKNTRHIREQLAAVAQPLIENLEARLAFPWINVYTGNDIICGSLDFFDPPDELNNPHWPKVWNVADEMAAVPIVAHVAYWKNHEVWDQLWRAFEFGAR